MKREDGVENGTTGVGLVRHRFNQFDTNKSKRKRSREPDDVEVQCEPL